MSPINVDISDLNDLLLKHNTQDDNRFDILEALSENNIELPCRKINEKSQNQIDDESKPKKLCAQIVVFNVDINAFLETLR